MGFFFLPILKPLVDFFDLIPLANTSSTVLNSSRDSGYLCPIPDFSGNVSSVSPLNKIQVLGLRCIFVWAALSQSSRYLDRTWEQKLRRDFYLGYSLCSANSRAIAYHIQRLRFRVSTGE